MGNRGEGVALAEVAERIGRRLADEKPTLGAWHGPADVDGAAGAARTWQLAGEVDLLVDRRAVGAEVEGRAGADVQREVSRRLKSTGAIADSEDPRGAAVGLVGPAAVLVRGRGGDEVKRPPFEVGVRLDADLSSRNRLSV